MSIRRSITLLSSQVAGPITLAYQRRIISGNLRSDSAQLLLSSKLDELYTSLISLPLVLVEVLVVDLV